MYNYLSSIIFGIVQGITEFFPISSSGHLLVLHQWLKFDLADNLAFDVALHLGTLLALLGFFRKEIVQLLRAWFKSFADWKPITDVNQRLAWLIFVGCIPAGLVGLFLGEQIRVIFSSPISVAVMLIFFGVLFIVFEKVFAKIKSISELNFKNVIIIGIAQALALIPGVSRSGISIIAGISQKLKREQAARFSFLLSIPVIFGAGLKKFYDLVRIGVGQNEILIFVLGTLAALVAGYLAIKYLLKFLEKYPLNVFAYYRFVLGGIIIVYYLI